MNYNDMVSVLFLAVYYNTCAHNRFQEYTRVVIHVISYMDYGVRAWHG